MSDEPRTIQLPSIVALVLCDTAYADRASGTVSLLGLIESVRSASFPTPASPMVVMVDLTDGVGRIPLSLRVTRTTRDDLDGETLLARDLPPVLLADPRLIRRVMFRFAGLSFPAPGEYRFILGSGNAVLIERRLLVEEQP